MLAGVLKVFALASGKQAFRPFVALSIGVVAAATLLWLAAALYTLKMAFGIDVLPDTDMIDDDAARRLVHAIFG